jgi:Xaa-Pro aminopeptidase
MREMGPRAVAFVHAPPEVLRNGDSHFPYRQSSDLLYLTGFAEPESALVLRPGAEQDRVVLFVRPRDRDREIWDGRRAGPEGAIRDFGAQAAYPIAELTDRLPGLLANHDDLYYSFGVLPEVDAQVARAIQRMRLYERRVGSPPGRIVDPRATLHEMRLRKSSEELELLARAARITGEAHVQAMKAALPGAWEYELQAVLEYTFRRRGATGPGYGTIVGAGRNATILHYIENDAQLREGDLVLIDAGAELQGHTADVTRTFPCGGRFTPEKRRLYEVVLRAQEEAIAMTRPGATIDGIHQRVCQLLTEGLVELGLLPGPAADRVADGAFKRYYMHRTSHWLGLDVHDVGTYFADGRSRPLEPGMVITIEPGLYVAEDDEKAPLPFRGVGVRIEDDVLVTADGHRVLTADIPKQVDDLERICSDRG